MKKIAILIGSPTHPYLGGVKHDINNMKLFLMSPIGGAWSEEEIFVPNLEPNYSDILPVLEDCKKCDFVLIYFSGHGFTDVFGKPNIVLNKNEYIPITYLNNKGKKQITIIDACRSYMEEFYNYDGNSLSGIGEVTHNEKDLLLSQNSFNSYLQKCKESNITLFACQEGETTQDLSDKGGRFSIILLEAAKYLATNSNSKIITIKELFEIIYQESNDGNSPDIEYKLDEALMLPFAVQFPISLNIKKENKKEKKIKTNDIIKYTIIGGGIVLIIVFIVTLIKKKK